MNVSLFPGKCELNEAKKQQLETAMKPMLFIKINF